MIMTFVLLLLSKQDFNLISASTQQSRQTFWTSLAGSNVNPLDRRKSAADTNNWSSSNSGDRAFKSLYAVINLNKT